MVVPYFNTIISYKIEDPYFEHQPQQIMVYEKCPINSICTGKDEVKNSFQAMDYILREDSWGYN
jgi:hypothetical protein